MAESLRGLGERRDAAGLAAELHRLHGAAHMLGFAELAEACAVAQRQEARAETIDGLTGVLRHLEVTSRSPFPDAEMAAEDHKPEAKIPHHEQ